MIAVVICMTLAAACGGNSTVGSDGSPASDLDRIVEEKAWDTNGDGRTDKSDMRPDVFAEYVNERLCDWASNIAEDHKEAGDRRQAIIEAMSGISVGNDGSWLVLVEGCIQIRCPEKFDEVSGNHGDEWPCTKRDIV